MLNLLELLENAYILIGTGITVLGAVSYFINSLIKKKKLLKSLGLTRKDVDKKTYKCLTSKEYVECLSYSYNEQSKGYDESCPNEENENEVV